MAATKIKHTHRNLEMVVVEMTYFEDDNGQLYAEVSFDGNEPDIIVKGDTLEEIDNHIDANLNEYIEDYLDEVGA